MWVCVRVCLCGLIRLLRHVTPVQHGFVLLHCSVFSRLVAPSPSWLSYLRPFVLLVAALNPPRLVWGFIFGVTRLVPQVCPVCEMWVSYGGIAWGTRRGTSGCIMGFVTGFPGSRFCCWLALSAATGSVNRLRSLCPPTPPNHKIARLLGTASCYTHAQTHSTVPCDWPSRCLAGSK